MANITMKYGTKVNFMFLTDMIMAFRKTNIEL